MSRQLPPIRPGELDPTALELARTSPDARQLPADLTPDTLFTSQDMSRRRIHLGALLLGLRQSPARGPDDEE